MFEEDLVSSGFKINKRAIRDMTRDLEKEFAKNPIRIPIEADPSGALPPSTTVNNYNGPVVTVNGGHAQVAWGNDSVSQVQDRAEQIAPGYEELARIVTDLLASLDTFSLGEDENAVARENAEVLLAEIVKAEPDKSVLRRGITM